LALWIVAASATNVALLGVVGLVIQLPGQAEATVTWLILVFLVLSALTIVFPVAGYALERREHANEEQRRQLEREAAFKRQLRDQVDRLLAEGSSSRLPRLSELPDERLGVTPTLYTKEARAPYVGRRTLQRDYDVDLRTLLAEPGPPYPFVVVWGTTKAGKSRTLAEAARAVFQDDPAVIIPQGGGQAVAELARLDLPVPEDSGTVIVWLDDLNPADLEALTSQAIDTLSQRAIIVATMTARRREEIKKTGGEVTAVARMALSRAREFELPFEMSEAERTEAQRLYPEERFSASVAETLVGGPELVAKYRAGQDSNPAGCAIVRAAIDCRRAGLSRPITEPELLHLFPIYLPMVRRGISPTPSHFADGLQWATHPIASQVSLLQASDPDQQPQKWMVFDHAVTADEGTDEHQPRALPAELWPELIRIVPTKDLFTVGLTAYIRHQLDVAIEAFRKASKTDRSEIKNLAKLILGMLLHEQGDENGARANLQQVIDSSDKDAAPAAAFNLGAILEEHGNIDGARTAYQRAIDSGHQEQAPIAAFNLGNMLKAQGDVEGARTAYQQVIDSSHHDAGPKSVGAIGVLLGEQGDIEGARAAYQRAIDSGHHDAAPQGAFNLGILLAGQGDIDGARAAYQQVIDSGHEDGAPMAAVNLGVLLAEQGDIEGARAAYQRAIDSGHQEQAPKAALNLGNMLKAQGDVEGAHAGYQRAIDSGQQDYAPQAATELGVLLAEQGDVEGARVAYQRAIDSGQQDYAPYAAVKLGVLLAEQGDVEGARVAYQRAIDSGQQDYAPQAAAKLGVLLAEQGDVEGACVAYQQAIDSGHHGAAPRGAFNLGVLLAEQGDIDGARTAYQQVIDSGHEDGAPIAAVKLGVLLEELGQVEGARAAYQRAIDSGHPQWKDRARRLLDNLPE
jgi:tetratricopeptide (TPR) repeat protein